MERSVSDCAEEYDGATYASKVPVLRRGRFHFADFGHDLRTPKLAKRISAVVCRAGLWDIVVNPIKQRYDPEFLVQACQCLLPPPHIGLFGPGCNVPGETQSRCRFIRLAGRFGWARSNTLHLLVALSSENHEMRETTDPTILGWEGQGIHENNGNEDQTHDRSRSGIRTEEISEGNLVDCASRKPRSV